MSVKRGQENFPDESLVPAYFFYDECLVPAYLQNGVSMFVCLCRCGCKRLMVVRVCMYGLRLGWRIEAFSEPSTTTQDCALLGAPSNVQSCLGSRLQPTFFCFERHRSDGIGGILPESRVEEISSASSPAFTIKTITPMQEPLITHARVRAHTSSTIEPNTGGTGPLMLLWPIESVVTRRNLFHKTLYMNFRNHPSCY